ncbi:MAG: phosphoribosylformylglycinamidine synthase subunit PurQ [Thermoguttaceae bacterium]|jgi:phosphoribosylformylglycinamidine synthase
MPAPNVLILRAPGTNCDQETATAFQRAGAKTQTVHVNRVLDRPGLLADFQILCIPGGFSYGDDVAAGQILAVQMRHHLAAALGEFKAAGKLILGICNGFQAIIKSGILLDDDPALGPPATLTYNDSGKYEDRWVRLGVSGQKCVFLRGIQRMNLPVAHGEGKFITRDAEVLERLDAAGQLVLRYLPLGGESLAAGLAPRALPFPDNPNGSMGNVAGICDTTGRVLGLMPHPERYIDPTQHPRWTRGESGPVGDGLAVFVNAVEYFG